MSIGKTLATTGLAFLATTAIPIVNGSPLKLPFKLPFKLGTRDPPTALPERATAGDKKWQPAMDFDTDGCYNTPAIDAQGNINPGLEHKDTGLASDCRDASDLENNNVYSRARCNNGWCAHFFDYYFEKDVAIADFPFDPGHRNDWEHIVVFVHNDEAKVVAVSQHGDYETKNASEVRWDGTHPKTVYHKDGVSTHNFRFANSDDDNIENHSGAWFYGDLVSYRGFPSAAIRDKLLSHDFGSASIGFKDSSFKSHLDKARGDYVVGFDSGKDDETSPGDPE
ncbi:secreted protein [Xylariaceae sp. FL0662B]|nr:secreted protein [Xylariaceae sp. FL0662B]